MSKTIHEVSTELRNSLIEYIEATYHISDPALLRQRHALLETVGVVHQSAFLESTPRYQAGRRFRDIVGIPQSTLELLELLAQPDGAGKQILYDPPYEHQSAALEHSLVRDRDLLIMTGTGSGKTESFLMPVLGKLAREAHTRPDKFATQPGMRALILYPMNALVNDQLGRLRGIFGDPRLVALFESWAGRPPRFARYTSRTPYAGVRTKEKDQRQLKQFGEFYVSLLSRAKENDESGLAAQRLIKDLASRGKWPAKPDLEAWYRGSNGRFWQNAQGDFLRAVTLAEDSELLTRHEAQAAAPDLLVTNYSMLEYMLMRPVERTIFDQTRAWLKANPEERFLLILDESHLYRGAGGAEVGLLLRRLRDRLNIAPDRFRVICATASFEDKEYGPDFASQLTGNPPSNFTVIDGKLLERAGAAPGTQEDVAILVNMDMAAFYSSHPEVRESAVTPFLRYRGTTLVPGQLYSALHEALTDFPPLAELVNVTMGKAKAAESLGHAIFPNAPEALANLAATNLAAIASSARVKADAPSLLPCRVHSFFRGLRGLWVCMDADCRVAELSETESVAGKLYSQPREQCDCGARILELYTCRVCGTAYARGYSDDAETPKVVWSNAGVPLRFADGDVVELTPIDLLLEAPDDDGLSVAARYDLLTGEINASTPGVRMRTVYLAANRIPAAKPDRDEDDDDTDTTFDPSGAFLQCGACGRKPQHGRSPVQDHETKGDQPFQVLLTQQLQVQPPGPQAATKFAPLRGRKVLAFSDSRQVAARLAPNLQMYSARDSLRPLLVRGWTRLAKLPNFVLRLDDIYAAVLLAANELGVRLRPELSLQEKFSDYSAVGEQVANQVLDSDGALVALCFELRSGEGPPEALLADLMSPLRDRLLGLEALAIGSIVERSDKRVKIVALPDIPGITENENDRVELARAWIRCWQNAGFWLPRMKQRWYLVHPDAKVRVSCVTGKFGKLDKLLGTPAAKKLFKEKWLGSLLNIFAEEMPGGKYRLNGSNLSISLTGQWVRCSACKSVHRPVRLINLCLDCKRPTIASLNPDSDEVFIKRKGYYRKGILAALSATPQAPMAIIAAEHTAQLNSAEQDDIFSKAEENELLFQDVELPAIESASSSAIDVLSSTTTMEVGIDIGQLSGVALRNMPPSRANYQQRAGRAGRRGNAIATVVAFGGSDSHDEHFFSEPEQMISGPVVDPRLSLDNPDIARRHIRAYLLQCYHQEKIPADFRGSGDLFSVLGKVGDFLKPNSTLSRIGLETWMRANEASLKLRVNGWIPSELSADDRELLVEGMVEDCLGAIDLALRDVAAGEAAPVIDDEAQFLEVPPEPDEEKPVTALHSSSLLDTLLYKGILPRYAFPTDVATFHVFDTAKSTRFRPKLKFAPGQGLAVALSQYAPGKQVWISGKCYTSGAIYSPMSSERASQWKERRLHLECNRCGYAYTRRLDQEVKHQQTLDCEACQSTLTLGPARYWMRPTGFAHPVDIPEVTSPDDIPETSYATRAKLTLISPDDTGWVTASERVRYLTRRTHLLVSNTGPAGKGYAYCVKCGRIEASTSPQSQLLSRHKKPFPDIERPDCPGGFTTDELVLGTDFITDVALFSLKLCDPIRLRAGESISKIALRTLSEALSIAATEMLDIESGEVLAEFRPAVTPSGVLGLEAEVFLYDTLPGGAGFAKQAAKRPLELFQRALEVMGRCPEGCDLSCYRCMRTFRNRIDHSALDRFVGVALATFLLTGELPTFNGKRIERATQSLLDDLRRHALPGENAGRLPNIVDRNGREHVAPLLVVSAKGKAIVVSVRNPLEEVSEPCLMPAFLADGKSAVLVQLSELLVRQNLPQATKRVMDLVAEL